MYEKSVKWFFLFILKNLHSVGIKAMICGTVIIQTDSFANKDCKEYIMEKVNDSNLTTCLESIVQFLKGWLFWMTIIICSKFNKNICAIFHDI